MKKFNELKKAAASWWYWNREGFTVIAIAFAFVGFISYGMYYTTIRECRMYGTITERDTKWAAGQCYVHTSKGWRSRGTTVEVRD